MFTVYCVDCYAHSRLPMSLVTGRLWECGKQRVWGGMRSLRCEQSTLARGMSLVGDARRFPHSLPALVSRARCSGR